MINSSGIPNASNGGPHQLTDVVGPSPKVPGGRRDRESRAIDFVRKIESLDDQELLHRLRGVVVKERRSTTTLLAHLAVLDGRRLYVSLGYSSLFNYCTRGLHFSEQAAYLRIEAARVVRRFPAVLARVAEGSIHLTALSLLRPHLTSDNYQELLDAACHRSRREVEDLVAAFRCGPASPPRARFDVLPSASHRDFGGRSGAGPMTNHPGSNDLLVPADGSSSRSVHFGSHESTRLPIWSSPVGDDGRTPGVDGLEVYREGRVGSAIEGDVPSTHGGVPAMTGSGDPTGGWNSTGGSNSTGGGNSTGGSNSTGGDGNAFVPPGGDVPYYRLHLTISSETRLKLEQARELLRHQVPDGDPGKILDRALGVLLDRLEQRKFARLMVRPTPNIGVRNAVNPPPAPSQAGATPNLCNPARNPGDPTPISRPTPLFDDASGSRGSREIPAAIRREVWYRDHGQCAYVGEDGVRCDRCGNVEYHHIIPWASGGTTTAANLSLRCPVHNAWEAEIAFARSPNVQGDGRLMPREDQADREPDPPLAQERRRSTPDDQPPVQLGPDRVGATGHAEHNADVRGSVNGDDRGGIESVAGGGHPESPQDEADSPPE